MVNASYLVNIILPNSGDSMTTKAYRAALADLGYNRFQQAGSVGGSISNGSTNVADGKITRN